MRQPVLKTGAGNTVAGSSPVPSAMARWRRWSARPPVTRKVGGSSPLRAATWPRGLMVRIADFQSAGAGSIPAGVTRKGASWKRL